MLLFCFREKKAQKEGKSGQMTRELLEFAGNGLWNHNRRGGSLESDQKPESVNRRQGSGLRR